MARMTTKLTTVLAGLALASLPAAIGAQGTASEQPRPGSSQQQQSRSVDQNSPQHHLDQAKKVLNEINPSSLQGEARTQITELKRNFNQLENAWRNRSGNSARSDSAHAAGHTSGTSGTTGTSGTATSSTTSEQTGTTSGTTSQTPRSDRPSPMAGNDDWMRHYQAIDSTLDRLIGASAADSANRSGTGTSGTTGTTGSASASASVEIDANLRSRLTEFRRHLDQFHAAAMSQNQRMGEEDRASADPHSGVTGSMTGTTGSSGTASTGTTSSGTMTSGTSGQTTSGTSGQATTGSQTRTPPSASGQVDSAAIARLTASIDELLRGTSTSGAAGTSGTTSSTSAGTTSSGTTSGTTGTASGTASAQATVCVDRAKLEQLKRDIQALNRNQQ